MRSFRSRSNTIASAVRRARGPVVDRLHQLDQHRRARLDDPFDDQLVTAQRRERGDEELEVLVPTAVDVVVRADAHKIVGEALAHRAPVVRRERGEIAIDSAGHQCSSTSSNAGGYCT